MHAWLIHRIAYTDEKNNTSCVSLLDSEVRLNVRDVPEMLLRRVTCKVEK